MSDFDSLISLGVPVEPEVWTSTKSLLSVNCDKNSSASGVRDFMFEDFLYALNNFRRSNVANNVCSS